MPPCPGFLQRSVKPRQLCIENEASTHLPTFSPFCVRQMLPKLRRAPSKIFPLSMRWVVGWWGIVRPLDTLSVLHHRRQVPSQKKLLPVPTGPSAAAEIPKEQTLPHHNTCSSQFPQQFNGCRFVDLLSLPVGPTMNHSIIGFSRLLVLTTPFLPSPMPSMSGTQQTHGTSWCLTPRHQARKSHSPE